MYEVLLVIFLLITFGLIGIIMLQQGKANDIGASFGAHTSATLFRSSSSSNFMTRTTVVLAILFFTVSLILGNLNKNKINKDRTWENLTQTVTSEQNKDSDSSK